MSPADINALPAPPQRRSTILSSLSKPGEFGVRHGSRTGSLAGRT